MGMMEDPPGNRLVQIQVIHRHGARSPEAGTAFPSICGSAAFRTFFRFRPHIPQPPPLHPTTATLFTPNSSASCYHGQLTPLGAAQMFALGARLRARYAQLLPQQFDPEQVVLRSTATRRTVESAVATLSGLFPAAEEHPTAVRIEVRHREEETMLGIRTMCNKLFDLQQAAHATFTFPNALDEPAERWLKPKTGDWLEGSRRALALRDIAIAMRENGCEVQPWEHVAENPAMNLIGKLHGPDSWGLGLGRFAQELLDEVEHHADTSWCLKIYSAHDTTLFPVLALFENKAHRGVPAFAADLVMETWVPLEASRETEPRVRLVYEGKPVAVSGCEQYGDLCPLSKVREAVARHIPHDREGACGGTMDQRRREIGEEQRAGEGTTL